MGLLYDIESSLSGIDYDNGELETIRYGLAYQHKAFAVLVNALRVQGVLSEEQVNAVKQARYTHFGKDDD